MQTEYHNTAVHQAEAVERQALEALHAVADEPLRAELGLSLHDIGDCLVSTAAALPSSAITINRAVGLGHRYPVQPEAIRAISQHYRRAGVQRYFLQPDPCTRDEDVAPHCLAADLERARAWQKFIRGRGELLPDVSTDLKIHKVGPGQGEAFAEIVCDAFDLGQRAIPWLARLPAAQGWQTYMAFDGDTPASTGGLFISGQDAFTDFGATAPAYRQRGLQLANLASRVRAAIDQGCQRIHTCTGIAVDGDPQHSYRNINKCGFLETHVREAWTPARSGA